MDIKILFAILGMAITALAGLLYIRDIISRKVKPHFITWLIWTVLASAGFAVQLIGGGGIGAYVLGLTAFFNVIILVLSVKYSKYAVSKFDITLLALSAISLGIWLLTSNPHVAAVCLTFTMAMGYIPTYKKSYHEPKHESATLFFLSGFKQALGIVALSAYNLLTLLFPVFLIFANFGLVGVILYRRKG